MNWFLATEDSLSRSVGLKLLKELGLEKNRITALGRDGNGYLRKNMDKWIELSKTSRVLLITDLDRTGCVPALMESWSNGRCLPENLLFRVAVREIESWVLADHAAVRDLIGKKGKLPSKPDDLDDPKRELLSLAKNAPRRIRDELVQEKKGELRQGFGYNEILCEWVLSKWEPDRAAQRSNSLRRAIDRIRDNTI